MQRGKRDLERAGGMSERGVRDGGCDTHTL